MPQMRYSLRTLLIVLALVPPLLAGAWFGWHRYLEAQNDWKCVKPAGGPRGFMSSEPA